MKKIPKLKRYLFFLLGLIAINTVVISMYVKSPLYTLNTYISHIQKGEYEKSLALIEQDFLSEQEMLEYMETYFSEKELVEVLKKEEVYKTDKECTYEVEYVFKDEKVLTQLHLVKEEEGWKMDIPFNKQALRIYAPLGTEVFVEGEQIKEVEGIYQTEELLEGNYLLEMVMPTENKQKKSHWVQIPEVETIRLEYEPCELVVEVEDGMEVSLGGIKRVSKQGQVRFPSLLKGTYTLEINDPHHNKESVNEKMVIHTSKQTKTIPVLPFSEEGKENVKKFMEEFYQQYEEGIGKKEDEFLKEYISSTYLPTAQKDFSEWFIQGKEIQEVKMDVEYEEPIFLGGNRLKINTFEEIYLENQEEQKTSYRIGIGWENILLYNKKEFIITQRQIKESIISVKDEEGEWIQY